MTDDSYVISWSELISYHFLFGYFSVNLFVLLSLIIVLFVLFWVKRTILSQSLSRSESTQGDCKWLEIIQVITLLLKMWLSAFLHM